MRVAHLNLSLTLGWPECQTLALVRALGDLAVSNSVAQTAVVHQSAPLARLCAGYAGFELRRVRSTVGAVLATRRADIVHVHDDRGLRPGAIVAYTGRPLVVTWRSPILPADRGLARVVLRRADSVTGVSQYLATALERSLGRRNVAAVHDSVWAAPACATAATVAAHAASPIVVGVLGELDTQRHGPDLAIDVARNLARSHPQIEVQLTGSGGDEALLRKRAAGLNNVRFVGPLHQAAGVLRQWNICLHPMRHEALGGAILDAMAHGIPVVATRVGGVGEIIVHNENGLLVEPQSVLAMQRAVAYLAERPERRAQLGHNARITALAHSAPAMAQRYFDIYMHVLGQRAAKRKRA